MKNKKYNIEIRDRILDVDFGKYTDIMDINARKIIMGKYQELEKAKEDLYKLRESVREKEKEVEELQSFLEGLPKEFTFIFPTKEITAVIDDSLTGDVMNRHKN